MQSSKGDAVAGTVIGMCAPAVIAQALPRCAGVGYMQLAPAVPATQQPREERSTVTGRAPNHDALHVGVVRNLLLVELIFVPPNVAFMMFGDQDLPVLPFNPLTL